MNIVVYCGANVGTEEVYSYDTKKLGEWISKNNHQLVYGGGGVGLMKIIADSVLKNQGSVIGVMPEFLVSRELAHKNLTELILVDSMSQRKQTMIEMGEVFIALPGGPGTLEEITEVVSWSRIGKNDSPCIFFNSNGYYDFIQKFYNEMVDKQFLDKQDREKILFSDSLTEIQTFIASYVPPSIRIY
ncbi:TIGR00730 family protein [Streptococcus infantarius subsp. infantarius]|nr:TIGR00730 family protein [Streptococcus infantarius subsp. infantarius]MCO4619759.1 TIGR00730 family protein [Streptococcus infantarius subsp. infantarius]